MFYAGGGYNYSNELMELLHNLIHDWPKDTALVALGGMLVNTTGKPNRFCEADINVEHVNLNSKGFVRGTNATPQCLKTITPVIGKLDDLSAWIFSELGVEATNQHHAKVRQHKDVEMLAHHLWKNGVFNFASDKPSEHAVVDLYNIGCVLLAGEKAGHKKHLAKHTLQLCNQDKTITDDVLESAAALDCYLAQVHNIDALEFALNDDDEHGRIDEDVEAMESDESDNDED